jgi:1-acyl-sn-glycerol-3-phosphate acyltransferase
MSSADESAQFSTRAARGAGAAGRLRYYATFVVAGLCFLILGVPLIPVGWLARWLFGHQDFIYPFGKFGARLYVWTAGARVHVSGLERLDPKQAYVFAANHQSNLDPPMLLYCLGRNPGWLAKKEVFRIPVMGQGLPLVHVISIDRSDSAAAIASTKRGAAVLRGGRSVVAFPEGTRSADGRLKPFKKGVFFMALEAGVPIAPIVINDTRLVMPKGANYCAPGDVFVEVLPPVSVAPYTPERVGELVERVRAEFVERVRAD